MAPRAKFTLPNRRQRLVCIGHTGCGKSQAGLFYLSKAEIEAMPWVIIDYKGEDLVAEIPYTKEIGINSDVPAQPGLYVVHPHPAQNDHVEKFLWRIWGRGNIGVFVDEAYNMPDKGAYQALLTQGRSKHVPMINLTQQPAWVPRHVFSESDHVNVFTLTDNRDKKRVNEFMPVNLDVPIPEYHSWWWRVKDRSLFPLRPVPEADSILETFERRLAPKRRVF